MQAKDVTNKSIKMMDWGKKNQIVSITISIFGRVEIVFFYCGLKNSLLLK